MPNMSFDFTGRSAIVTGAARGIGLAIARHFHAAGATVFMVDLDQRRSPKRPARSAPSLSPPISPAARRRTPWSRPPSTTAAASTS